MSTSLPVLRSLITHSGESANRRGRGVTARPKAAALTIDVWGGPKPSSTIHWLPRKLNCGPGRPKPCAGFSWDGSSSTRPTAVSYTHLRAHETDSYLVCRLLLEK